MLGILLSFYSCLRLILQKVWEQVLFSSVCDCIIADGVDLLNGLGCAANGDSDCELF